MSRTTSDRNDPDINVPQGPMQQNKAYIVLSKEELAKGFVRPVRDTYVHNKCLTRTTMGRAIAETYAARPTYYSGTWCCACSTHLPLSEFQWLDGQMVGS